MTLGKLSRIRRHPERFRHLRRSVIKTSAKAEVAAVDVVPREKVVVEKPISTPAEMGNVVPLKKPETKRKKAAKG